MSDQNLFLIGIIFSLLFLENLFSFFPLFDREGLLGYLKHDGFNFALGAFNTLLSTFVISVVYDYTFNHPLDFNLLRHLSFIPTWSWFLITFISLDLYIYIWHRLNHTIPFLWQFHKLHHTDTKLNLSTAYRFHPVEIFLSHIPRVMLISIMGFSSVMVVTYQTVFTLIVALHHSNLQLPQALDQILAKLIVSPNFHRIHHSQKSYQTNSNYASVFSFWDKLFHTFQPHTEAKQIRYGLD